MSTFFVPYTKNAPAAVEIKGHRLLILASSPEDLEEELELVGANEIRPLRFPDEQDNQLLFADFALKNNCGVVLTPSGVPLSIVISNLEDELPWVQ